MILFLIIFTIVIFSFISIFFQKHNKLLILIPILFIIFFYLFLSKDFFDKKTFFPTKDIVIFSPCGNFYNLLTNSVKEGKLNILDNIDKNLINRNNPFLLDTSIYNEKIYLYFGLTPVLLFYLPFNLISGFYLTDRFLIFLTACFIFLLSLSLIKKILKSITNYDSIPTNIVILSIFIIGFCNLLPFLVLKSFIYEVPITTAHLLLLLSLSLSWIYVNQISSKKQNIFVFFISLLLCLAVGARPYCIFFIPIFLIFIIIVLLNNKYTISHKELFKTISIFLIPCIIYGVILALYNYLRFDSIFEFGFKHQINYFNFSNLFSINDLFVGVKNNFLTLPNINEITFFALTNTQGHNIGNDYIAGIFWTYPLIFILTFVNNFLKQIYKKNKNYFMFFLLLISIIIINIIVLSFFGTLSRFIFEYLSLIVILSIIMFLFYVSEAKDPILKYFLNIIFIILFIFSVFINISLLFCKDNFHNFISLRESKYSQVVKFLFKK